MKEQLLLLPEYLSGHLQLALVALAIGTAVSVPLGVWASRHTRVEAGVLSVASILQTVPGLALLAIMVPALAVLGGLTERELGFSIRSIGYPPALVALTLYSVLPILRNTVTGIAGVDRSIIEAAQGVGMTDRQRLLQVELPLALPVIVAGVRTSTVWVVGTATLSTPVGATSLGNYIFTGLQTRNFSAVLVGCVAAAGLALLLDQAIRVLEFGVRERRRRFIALGVGVLAALYGIVAVTFAASWIQPAAPVVRIGSKTFTEQYILSEILAQRVQREFGIRSQAVQSLGSTVAFDALRNDELDLYVDYSGTIWATIMKRDPVDVGREQVLREVSEYLDTHYGIGVVGALGFENAYALGMRADRARELGVERISDLVPQAGRMEIGGDYEFFQRAEWAAIVAAYHLAFRRQRSMDSSLMYQAVARGEVDVISAFSTDGRIAAFDIRLLEDDRGAIPPYDAILLASPRVRRELPEVLEALRPLRGSIDEAAMQEMNLAVDLDGRSPAEVARDFLDRFAAER